MENKPIKVKNAFDFEWLSVKHFFILPYIVFFSHSFLSAFISAIFLIIIGNVFYIIFVANELFNRGFKNKIYASLILGCFLLSILFYPLSFFKDLLGVMYWQFFVIYSGFALLFYFYHSNTIIKKDKFFFLTIFRHWIFFLLKIIALTLFIALLRQEIFNFMVFIGFNKNTNVLNLVIGSPLNVYLSNGFVQKNYGGIFLLSFLLALIGAIKKLIKR